MARLSLKKILAKKTTEPIVMITAYDATMARLVDELVDVILVGDSLGMVVQGHDTTLPVTLDEMIYHVRMVVRGSSKALVLADLPFMSYQVSTEQALRSAGRCLQEGGAQAIKLEGGREVCPQVRAITNCGIPVVGHLGVTPQAIHALGGYAKQGKTEETARRLIEDAKALEEAGAAMVVLENIPHEVAEKITAALSIPTIGIGAGKACDGQVQVFHDLCGFNPDFLPRHARKLADCGLTIREAVQSYAADVRARSFLSE